MSSGITHPRLPPPDQPPPNPGIAELLGAPRGECALESEALCPEPAFCSGLALSLGLASRKTKPLAARFVAFLSPPVSPHYCLPPYPLPPAAGGGVFPAAALQWGVRASNPRARGSRWSWAWDEGRKSKPPRPPPAVQEAISLAQDPPLRGTGDLASPSSISSLSLECPPPRGGRRR